MQIISICKIIPLYSNCLRVILSHIIPSLQLSVAAQTRRSCLYQCPNQSLHILFVARGISTELIFDLFICPAIIEPVLHGLTSDVTVGRIARHNLMQVARILQVLSKGQRLDEKQRIPDLYSLFQEVSLAAVADSDLTVYSTLRVY